MRTGFLLLFKALCWTGALGLALAVRIWILRVNGELNADEVIPGLMGLHIARGTDFPVFFYGQHYFGALEAYAVAGLFRSLGFQPWLVVVPALAASVLLAVVTYALASRLGGPLAGAVAAVPLIVPPPILAKLLANSGGGFSLAFLLQGLTLLAFLHASQEVASRRASKAPDGKSRDGVGGAPDASPGAAPATATEVAGRGAARPRRRGVLSVGVFSLTGGLLCWVWQPAIALCGVLGLLLLWQRRRDLGRPAFWLLLLVPPLAGLIPPLRYNLANDWATVTQLAGKYAAVGGEAPPGTVEGLSGVFSLLMMALGGGNESDGGVNPLQAGLLLWSVPVALLAAWRYGNAAQGRRESASRSGESARGGGRAGEASVLLLACVINASVAHSTARHLVPVACIAYVLLGAALAGIARSFWQMRHFLWKLIAALTILLPIGGLVVAPNVVLLSRAAGIFRHFVASVADIQTVRDELLARDLRYGYSDYWTAFPLIYFSGEQIIVAPQVPTPWGDRYDRFAPYSEAVDAVQDSSHMFVLLDARCTPLLFVMPLEMGGASFRLEQIARWYLISEMQPGPDGGEDPWPAMRTLILKRQYC